MTHAELKALKLSRGMVRDLFLLDHLGRLYFMHKATEMALRRRKLISSTVDRALEWFELRARGLWAVEALKVAGASFESPTIDRIYCPECRADVTAYTIAPVCPFCGIA